MAERARAMVAARGGTIVEGPAGTGNARHFVVRCAEGHVWKPRVANLANGSWCPGCYGNVPDTLENMHKIAADRGGRCLSDEYRGSSTHLSWECALGHKWDATPRNVRSLGSWCPACCVHVGEGVTRAAFEEAFPGSLFPQTRGEGAPEWLGGLELDGYNADLALAFEYHGQQHYEHVSYFHRDGNTLEKQKARDLDKIARCEAAGVCLVAIPFSITKLKIREFARAAIVAAGYEDLSPAQAEPRDFLQAATNALACRPDAGAQLGRVRAVAVRKGGVCLAERIVGFSTPVPFRCREGHEFLAAPSDVCQPERRGPRFCPACGGTSKMDDDTIAAKVTACGYRFVSTSFDRTADGRSRRVVCVVCPAGHPSGPLLWDNFSPDADGKPRRGCAQCVRGAGNAGRRGDIGEWLETHGIRLVGEYRNGTTPYEWRCVAAGHTFTATFVSLKLRSVTCVECRIVSYGRAHNFDHVLPTVALTATTPIIWTCRSCGKTPVISVIAMSRKERFCCDAAQALHAGLAALSL